MDDDKAVTWFTDGLANAKLDDRVEILAVEVSASAPVVEFAVEVPDVADWDLRYAVLGVAAQMEDDHALTVFCYFRQRVDAPALAR